MPLDTIACSSAISACEKAQEWSFALATLAPLGRADGAAGISVSLFRSSASQGEAEFSQSHGQPVCETDQCFHLPLSYEAFI